MIEDIILGLRYKAGVLLSVFHEELIISVSATWVPEFILTQYRVQSNRTALRIHVA